MPISRRTRYHRPDGSIAGFTVHAPEAAVPELVHAGEQWVPAEFAIPDHTHEVWEFYLQVSGASEWESNGVVYPLAPGGFFAAAPGVHHHLRRHPRARHHFLFAAIDLEPIVARYPNLRGRWQGRPIVAMANAQSVMAPFRLLIREVSLELPDRAQGLRMALEYVVLEASRLCQTTSARPLLGGHPAVARAKELIDHLPQNDWRIGNLARRCGISATHLAECFSRDVGLPPRQYLLQVRVARSRELLEQTDIPITQLALDLGFGSSQHFAAVFKRLSGATPREYRAQSRPASGALGPIQP